MSEKPTPPRARMISLRLKILIVFTLVFSLVFAGAFYWFYEFSTQRAMARVGDDLRDTLKGAAMGINAEELRSLYRDGAPNADNFSDDPRYQKQIAWMDTVHQIEPRAWPYTYVRGDTAKDPKEVIFVADLWSKYEKSHSTGFREHFSAQTYHIVNGLTEPAIKLDIYTDKWGSWVSGYTPISDANGNEVGALGIDFTADYVMQVQQAIKDNVFIAFAVAYIVLFVLVFVISRGLTQPIVKLTRAAKLIGEGKYEQDLSHLHQGRTRDEIGTLAEVFEIMVSKVYQREQNLSRRVEELKIEIDEVKRQKQVSEIAETDFFRDLQSKANSMRSRKHSQTDEAGDKAS